MRTCNLVTICVLGLITPCAMAGDWPNWRGTNHTGISNETNWGGNWANCTPNVLWQRQIGTGFSSIAVVEGRLYTMGNSAEKDTVYCLDADNGATLWTSTYSAPLEPKNYEGGPSATPTVADGKVYTLSKKGVAYCLDATDGSVQWQSDLATLYSMRPPTWGFAGSAYLDGNLVIYNVGTHGLALNAADGTLAWQTGTGAPGYSTPVPFDFEKQRYVLLMGKRTFAAVRAETGQLLWEQSWLTSSYANIPDPVVDSNLVFVSTGYNEGSALFDVSTGRPNQVWFQKNMQTKLNTSVLWQGYFYGPNDKGDAITCVERSTGDIVWTQGGFGNGSVTLAEGKLIILSESGYLCIAEASPAGYKETARGRILSSRCWSVPVLANGRIYARNAAGDLVCVEMETTAPKVDAGGSVITWLKDNETIVALNGSVLDDTGDVTTVRWSVISSPPRSTIDLSNDSAANTTAALTVTGSYVFELHAEDATGQKGSDQMQVRVYADGCEAARNDPTADYAPPLYDYDNDCIETFGDFAIFAQEWMQTNNLGSFAAFAARWLEDGSLKTDVLYDAAALAPTSE